MSWLTIAYISLFYVASFVFIIGLFYRIFEYVRVPAPLKIPTTPAPVNRAGVLLRLSWEVIFFRSLFGGAKWVWLFGWIFHLSLLLIFFRHLRYFVDPVWWWVELAQPFGVYAGFAMVVALLALWARRFFVERVRYISVFSDHFLLFLLIAIAVSGLAMKYLLHTDITTLKDFVLGMMNLDWQELPGEQPGETADFMLLLHLFLVAILMMIFPYSKLMHGVGLFFCPTRNQVDNPRAEVGLRSHKSRHVARWAIDAESATRSDAS
uniref:Nitrate reductase gamma subunit n=1 Tax=Candidatus Kentrum sp. SD TaxID=2126332 RepID=A0A450YXW4_9GAMM|nr:MAG: Nitrate reductase gamma subunit [Candidatus Kentron sp. SD]VFK46289.1 MAG: Nitrate reductase gamma subunit [Candidatus Kentron sp. SD]VFK79979.1 MAG: Nitrate reductase gamma subunit [Candidatus Kentron sp. SD]